MPTLARTFIKTALIYFVVALALSVLLSAQNPLGLPSSLNALRPVYFHAFMVGWVTQMIFGVAYWMFPKFTKEQPRRSERLAWMVYWLINLGLALRIIGEPLLTLNPAANAGWMVALSAALQLAAGWGFVINTWSRVKER